MASKHLGRASRIMAQLSLAGAVLYLTGEIGVFLFPGLTRATGFFEMRHGDIAITGATPLLFRLAALGVDLVPAGLAVWALLSLRRLFLLYAKGLVFTAEAQAALSRVAQLMFWQVLAGILVQPPISFLLSWPTAHHAVSVGIGSGDFSFLFMAGVVLVIARVMQEARRLADENAGFV